MQRICQPLGFRSLLVHGEVSQLCLGAPMESHFPLALLLSPL